MDHSEKARALFYEGYNCSQAVVCAFEDVTGIDIKTSARLSSSFGGGMGRLREVCGAVSGGLLILGILRGYDDPEDYEAKVSHYQLVQEFARRFREKNGTIICRELLKDSNAKPGNTPEPRTPEFYASRPCARLISEAAQIVDEMLKESMQGTSQTNIPTASLPAPAASSE